MNDSATQHAVDEEQSKSLLAFCKATADQLRLDVLRVLSRDSYGVMELCQIFAAKQSGMSHHLKILANANLVQSRREGNSIFYRRAQRVDGLNVLQRNLFYTLDQQPLSAHLQKQVDNLQQQRAASSQQFFSENADKFHVQQEQIAAYSLYGHQAIELIDRCLNQQTDTVLEVGPGEGAFLAELSPRFQRVIALDNSRQLLTLAKDFAEQQQLDNIDFILGDTRHPAIPKLSADCAVVNMVLHHISSPAEIFFDLANVLKPGGQLFVTDLCRHDQEWVKTACGDFWLGFEPEDLTLFAEEAGFLAGEAVFLAQRNGFQVQIRQFIKGA